MGLKNRSKVSAEFSMSSLTDIIFLLLIFFMLTSSLVVPNSLNLKLPGKTQKPPAVPERPLSVKIDRNGNFSIEGNSVTVPAMTRDLAKFAREKSANRRNITIMPDPKTPHEKVAVVMDIAMKYQINAILATKSK